MKDIETLMTTLSIPTIHLNGSSGDVLRVDNIHAAKAVRAAMDAICAAAPHARDYYVKGDGAFEKARTEHDARLQALHDVYSELLAIGAGITDQISARSRT